MIFEDIFEVLYNDPSQSQGGNSGDLKPQSGGDKGGQSGNSQKTDDDVKTDAISQAMNDLRDINDSMGGDLSDDDKKKFNDAIDQALNQPQGNQQGNQQGQPQNADQNGDQ